MKKVNQDYWQRRAVRYERDWNKRCAETVEKRLARHYERALSAIKDDILQLYATFAKDNGLDFNEARRALSSREFREWRMSMREYIEANDAGLTRELNTLAMQPRISRLEKLYGETLQELDKLGRNVSDEMRNFLTGAYKDNYSRDIFDLVKVGGLSVALAHVDSPSVEKVLSARWSGKNYSQRIWTNTRLLSKTVRETVTTGVHRGLSIPQLSKMVEDKMHGGYGNAVRLVQTEMSFVNNQAHADSMEAAGIAWYEFIATLDNRTSAPCRSRDGESYPLEEKTVGFNYPPLHPRCRSTVAPFIDGVSKSGTRIAKVGKDTIHIPASMSYRDYESVYVKKEKTFEQWQNDSKFKIVKSDFKISSSFRGLAAGNEISMAAIGTSPKLIGSLDNMNQSIITNALEYFEKQIVKAPVENAIIITKHGDVYHCTGDLNHVDTIEELGEKLKGAFVTHNHPVGSDNEYTFSVKDRLLFEKYELTQLRGIDEKFIYEFNRDIRFSEKPSDIIVDEENSTNSVHLAHATLARFLGVGYRRWRHGYFI